MFNLAFRVLHHHYQRTMFLAQHVPNHAPGAHCSLAMAFPENPQERRLKRILPQRKAGKTRDTKSDLHQPHITHANPPTALSTKFNPELSIASLFPANEAVKRSPIRVQTKFSRRQLYCLSCPSRRRERNLFLKFQLKLTSTFLSPKNHHGLCLGRFIPQRRDSSNPLIKAIPTQQLILDKETQIPNQPTTSLPQDSFNIGIFDWTSKSPAFFSGLILDPRKQSPGNRLEHPAPTPTPVLQGYIAKVRILNNVISPHLQDE